MRVGTFETRHTHKINRSTGYKAYEKLSRTVTYVKPSSCTRARQNNVREKSVTKTTIETHTEYGGRACQKPLVYIYMCKVYSIYFITYTFIYFNSPIDTYTITIVLRLLRWILFVSNVDISN